MANIISASPHIRGRRTTRNIMLDVIIALIPAAIMGIVYFGGKAAFNIAIAIVTCSLTEFIWRLIERVPVKKIIKQFDLTSVVTGLILALSFPVLDYKYCYVIILASIFAIAVAKMLFGGTGKNIVNPAIVGRVFAFIAFMSVMTATLPAANIAAINSPNAVSSPTPLTEMLTNGLGSVKISNIDLFLGTGVAGAIGETCKLAIILGFIYLVIRKVIKWQWPVIYIGVTGLIACAFEGTMNAFLPAILSGGLFFGAVFMATDYVTSPNNKWACYVYYVILGLVTGLLREGTQIEVVSYAILLCNLIVPLLNAWIRPRPFGAKTIKQTCQEFFAKLKVKKNKNEEDVQK